MNKLSSAEVPSFWDPLALLPSFELDETCEAVGSGFVLEDGFSASQESFRSGFDFSDVWLAGGGGGGSGGSAAAVSAGPCDRGILLPPKPPPQPDPDAEGLSDLSPDGFFSAPPQPELLCPGEVLDPNLPHAA